MANEDRPFGLRPVGYKSGAPYNGAARPYSLKSDYAVALFIGDTVIKNGTSNLAAITVPGGGTFGIGTLPEVIFSQVGDASPITGVIVGFSPLATNLESKHNPASTERVAYVADDPDLIFEIQADGAVPAASIGLNAVLIATHAGSTTTGLSGLELDTTSDVPAADASNQLLILRAVDREDNDTTLTWAKVLVCISNHTESVGHNAATDGILGI